MNPGDWDSLWRSLARADVMASDEGERQMLARWQNLARQLDSGERDLPDPLLDFVLSRLDPGMTVLDIGAGIGRWTIPMAERVAQLTAVEPLAGMRDVLADRLRVRGVTNVSLVASDWHAADVPTHDVAVAVHSTYTSPDLAAFAGKMDAKARRACYIVFRLPAHDGVMGELAQRITGTWHDSPNFIVGYNLLLAAGFCPNVLVEASPARAWTDASLAEAIARAKRHLHLPGDAHDALIREVLERHLVESDGTYRWPDNMRSALAWWETPAR